MSELTAAIAIMFPGVRAADLKKAAKEYNANILLKEQYDPRKNYARQLKQLSPIVSGADISLIFIFSDGSSMIAANRRDINKVMKRIVEVHGCTF